MYYGAGHDALYVVEKFPPQWFLFRVRTGIVAANQSLRPLKIVGEVLTCFSKLFWSKPAMAAGLWTC